MDKPADILKTTTQQIQKLIEKTLKIEKDFQYIQNIEADKTLERDISNKIKRIIELELKQ